ncbi:MAG: hypothetical protein WBM87_12860 [Woeseiaceae bacterium]
MAGFLQDKAILITDAAAGICLGIARACASAGAPLQVPAENLV